MSRAHIIRAAVGLTIVLAVLYGYGQHAAVLYGYGQHAGRHALSKTDLAIYVYDLPARFNEDVRLQPYAQKNYEIERWILGSREYDADLRIYEIITSSKYRTLDPDAATVFYLPVFPSRAYHLTLYELGFPGAVNHSSVLLADAIDFVRETYPYWNRTNGRDHFTAITADTGRLTHAYNQSASTWGDLFLLQHHGDRAHDSEVDEFLHTSGEDRFYVAYRPGHDVLIPSYTPASESERHAVHHAGRHETSVLYPFTPYGRPAMVKYAGVRPRERLRKLFDEKPIPGASWPLGGLGDMRNTSVAMTRSIFCATPPGIVAHTSRCV